MVSWHEQEGVSNRPDENSANIVFYRTHRPPRFHLGRLNKMAQLLPPFDLYGMLWRLDRKIGHVLEIFISCFGELDEFITHV